MKKTLAVLLALCLVFTLTATAAFADGKLIVGFDAEFPPYGFLAEDGSYDGFDLAMAKEVCDRLGWEFEAVPIDWDAKDAELSSGNINCIWNGFTYTGREDQYTWSEPYVDNSIVLVVKADSGISSLADLAGKTVMAQAGSSAVDAVADKEGFKDSLGGYIELPDCKMDSDAKIIVMMRASNENKFYTVEKFGNELKMFEYTKSSKSGTGFMIEDYSDALELYSFYSGGSNNLTS